MVVKKFFYIENVKLPLVSNGTSPFIGAGQFGFKAFEWRRKFLNNPDKMVEILETSYQYGARGIEAIPIGKIMDASRIMSEIHSDYIVTGSTYPGKDSSIDLLIKAEAKIIFVHGMIADNKGKELSRLLDDIVSHGIIPGIATHEPIPTIKYTIDKSLNVKAFLIPFNAVGVFMGNVKSLEHIVDKPSSYYFIGMKTLAAGNLDPVEAFEYISKHNISAVTIGMVTKEEAKISTKVALNAFASKNKSLEMYD